MVSNSKELMRLRLKKEGLMILQKRENALAMERRRINALQDSIRKNRATSGKRIMLRKAIKQTAKAGLKLVKFAGKLELAGMAPRRRRVRVRRRRR